MLLEFRMGNFKSFKEETVFKMTPAPKITDLNYSVINKTIANKNIKVLPTAVIYGPNAGGKTNVIGGMEVLKAIILKGDINDNDKINSYNISTCKLFHIPNIKSKETEPVNFYIKFIVKEIVFEYELKILLGTFYDSKFDRKILSEKLVMNNKLVFDRKDGLEINYMDSIVSEYLVEGFSKDIIKVAKRNLEDKELFLSNMFRNAISKKIYDMFIEWFKEKFNIIYRSDELEILPPMPENMDRKNKKFYTDKVITKIAKNFGSVCSEIAYPISENEMDIIPLSLIDVEPKGKKAIVPSEAFESLGTVRFFNIFPLVKETIENGNILVVDEFDNSLHPMVIMNLIMIFHNDEINKKGAQLIFNTHNPIFLKNTLFRRDEIHFVEKNNEKYSSTHYILSDFGTTGKNGVRKNDDYMEHYFINKYGAIENIDLSEEFEI